jgi:hypothetical protein
VDPFECVHAAASGDHLIVLLALTVLMSMCEKYHIRDEIRRRACGRGKSWFAGLISNVDFRVGRQQLKDEEIHHVGPDPARRSSALFSTAARPRPRPSLAFLYRLRWNCRARVKCRPLFRSADYHQGVSLVS